MSGRELNDGTTNSPADGVPPPAKSRGNGAAADAPAPEASATQSARGETSPKSDSPEKSERVKLDDAPPETIFDDLANLRRTATLRVSRRVIPVNVAVRKPANNVFFRCHPDSAMSLDASIIVGGEGSDDYYFVAPHMLTHHALLPRLRPVRIAVVYSWPGGSISLWPVPFVEESRIACWRSARAAYEQSKSEWTQLLWSSERRDYDVATAEGIFVEPAWPADLNMTQLLKLAFADRIIASPDHPYVLQLRGVAG
jgi:hypothetical protein